MAGFSNNLFTRRAGFMGLSLLTLVLVLAVGWLLVIELVLGQNLLGRCLAAIQGPVG